MVKRLGVLALLVSGCMTAEMIRRPDEPGVAYAPENEVGTGEIKYYNAGADSVKADRRADAYRQMYEVCGGSYKIDAETDSADVDIGLAMMGATETRWRHIRFSCTAAKPKKARAVPVAAP